MLSERDMLMAFCELCLKEIVAGKHSNDLPSPTELIDDRAKCSRKQTSSIRPSGQIRKKKGAAFLREQISQLVTSFSSTPVPGSIGHVPPSVPEAIKSFEQLTEVFKNMPFYLFFTRLLEDVTKRDVFMSISVERRVLYLRYFYEKSED